MALQFSSVSLAFGDRDILKNASINLSTGSKAALTGANGAGKSTLLRVMAGLIPCDSGERVQQKGTRIGYLPQSGLTHKGLTLIEEADSAFKWGYDIQKKIDEMGEGAAKDEGDKERFIEEQAALITKLENSGFYRRAAAEQNVLIGLGFLKSDMNRKTEEFSGGYQMRIALAKVLLMGADYLLLDEPTNYLDLEAREWLEEFLKRFTGGFLLVSHDRYFLDVTINEVYELFGGVLKRYSGNFTHYEEVRAIELKTLMAEYQKQQDEIAHLEDFIRRFGSKATKAAQAQDRQKRLDKINENLIVIPENLKKIHFAFPPSPHSGRIVLRLTGVTKKYTSNKTVLDGLDLLIEAGEKVVAAGANGAGKSTLLRIIAGVDSAFTGERTLGSGVKIGYFSQDSAETIKGKESVLEAVEASCPTELVPKARDMLGAFLFRGDDVFKSLDVLSGGEKSRIALLHLLLRPVNFLVLDEPTNHLDMHSKDVLLDALKYFSGTVIFVSHDRGFIEALATRVLELKSKDGRTVVRNFLGGYQYYAERVAEEEKNAECNIKKDDTSAVSSPRASDMPTEAKIIREEKKKNDAARRRAEKEVVSLEREITALEERKKRLEESLADSNVYTNGEKCRAIQKEVSEVNSALDTLNEKWENAVMAVM